MDITVILPSTNKAGKDLICMLEQDSNQKDFKKIVSTITSYMCINRHLLERQVIMQNVYDIIYRNYIEQIKKNFNSKYTSHILSILHTKYVDYLIELKKMLESELYEEYNNNHIEEND